MVDSVQPEQNFVTGYCGYSISDQYAPTTRFFFYAMVILGILGARIRYKALISTALNAVFLFSCVAGLHASMVGLTGAYEEEVDFDAIPAMTMTCVAAILAGPIFTASRTLRRSVTPAYRLALALSWTPAFASITMWGAISSPYAYCSIEENRCQSPCTASRNGREAEVIEFKNSSKILMIVLSVASLSPTLSSTVLLAEFLPKRIFDRLAKSQIVLKVRYGFYAFNLLIAAVQIVGAEYILMGPEAIPFNESFASVGIWGPAAVTVMALSAAIYSDWEESCYQKRQAALRRKRARGKVEVRDSRSIDVEEGMNGVVITISECPSTPNGRLEVHDSKRPRSMDISSETLTN